MEWILEESWREKLKDELDKPYYRELMEKVREEYKNETCYPPEDKIFNALNLCPFDKVKVVIMAGPLFPFRSGYGAELFRA